MSKEYVLCAAIWFDDGKKHPHQPKNVETGLVLCGWRHHCIFPQMGGLLGEITTKAARVEKGIKETQGFLTSHNRFVDRNEAGIGAFHGFQIDKIKQLFSEDLY